MVWRRLDWREGCVGKAGVHGGRVGERVDGADKTVREVGCRNSCTRFIHPIHSQVGSNFSLLSLLRLLDQDNRARLPRITGLVCPGSPGFYVQPVSTVADKWPTTSALP